MRVCDESDCSIGYLASCESNMSEIPDEIAEEITSVSDDWVIVERESEIKVDNDWLVQSDKAANTHVSTSSKKSTTNKKMHGVAQVNPKYLESI